jgi:hypothetical protein
LITLERPAYYDSKRYNEYCGLSTDDKTIVSAYNGDEFYEINTGKYYKYNQVSNEWVEQPEDTAAIDTGLPPITDETSGHFLSNDGNVTHWQALASRNFVIQLTENVNNKTYTADKTYVEIKSAFDAKENLVVRLNSSEFSLMNVEFANENEAGFTFGYTEVRLDGQVIETRSIQYTHSNGADNWSDSDDTADLSEYLSLSGGILSGRLHLADNPTEDLEAATKYYVDNHNMIVRFTSDAVAGFNADKSIQEIVAASLAKKYISGELNGDVYGLTSISATEVVFTRVDENKVSTISYLNGAWSKSEQTLLPLKGGKMDGNINMNSNSITSIQKLHVDGSAPIYIGSVIEPGINAPRLVGSTGGSAAFVKASSQSEYVPVAVGTPSAPDHAVNLRQLTQEVLADAPTADGCIANKKYVDDCVARKVPLVAANPGELKAYLQNGTKPDVCLVSDAGGAQCIARYTSDGHLIDTHAPTGDNQLANKKYVDDKLAAYSNVSGSLQIAGDLTVNGSAAVIKAPVNNVDIPNKGYVDTQINSAVADTVRKQSIEVGANSSVDVTLSNGVYLVTTSDNAHGGLTCVAVYPDGETITGLVNLNGWKCEKITSGKGINLTNVVGTSMTVYITSIGEGTYR